mgnify:CR=1 FL=1
MNAQTPSRQQIRSWINRQRTRPNPSKIYLAWLRTQFRIRCEAEVIKGKIDDKERI